MMSASPDQLMQEIDDLLRGIFHRYLKHGDGPPQHLDTTIGQIHCLHTIDHLGAPSMSELADALQLQPGTVTGLVDALVEGGLVTRRDDPDDRRVVRAALTAKGKRGRDRRRKAMRQRLMKLLGDIGEDDLRQVHQALTVLHDAAVRRAGERHGNPDPGDKEREG